MITSLLPQSLREFLPFISPSAFHVVSKTELFSRLTEIARRRLSFAETEALRTRLVAQLPSAISLVPSIDRPLSQTRDLSVSDRQRAGDAILALYFNQLFNPGGVFCDLRLAHFQLQSPRPLNGKPHLEWAPPAYWFKFSESFRKSLLELYEGFYLGQPDQALKAIYDLDLVPMTATPQQVRAMRIVLEKQFGPGDQRAVRFSLARFRSSFHDVFEVVTGMHHQIPVDFALLGVYLIGLYWALEQLELEFDVRAIYLAERQRLTRPASVEGRRSHSGPSPQL